MTDTARLQIRADSKGVVKATSELDRLERQGRKTERATDGLGSSISKLASAAVVVTGLTAALMKLTNVNREFQGLRASIETVAGSADRADVAFQAIQDFAANTPYDLAQATSSFLKLVNMGLTPSERALKSYGNTASAMGKSMQDMIEAVADAATGEFERLKEFGIRAKNEGETIKFTFQGVTTEVKNNAAAIEGYLMQLGENQFAGQMEKQMETLNGAISNLGDEWNKVFYNIGEAGAADAIEDAIRYGIDALAELNAQLASGQLEAHLDAIFSKFDGFGRDIATTLDIIEGLWMDFLGTDQGGGIAHASNETVDFIIEAFKNIPENMRAIIQLTTVEVAMLVEYGRAYGRAFAEVIGSELAALVEKGKVYGEALGNAINPFSDDSFNMEEELKRLNQVADEMATESFRTAERNVQGLREARRGSIEDILNERDEALASFEAQMDGARNLREEYDRLSEERMSNSTDRLAQFKVGGEEGSGGEDSATSKDFDKLVDKLRTEEEAIQESYERRRQIIIDNTKVESEERQRLLDRLKEQRDQQYDKLAEDRMAEVEKVRQSLLSEEEALMESYQRRREIVLENEQITEEQRQELMLGLEQQYQEKAAELETKRQRALLQAGEKTFGALAGLAKAFAGEQSEAYRAMFAVSQAFALTDATMKMYQAIQAAWASAPYPANLGPVAIATAETGANVAAIASQSFAGAYDEGGSIPSGKVGLVGEIGPELVSGPARVIGRKDTEKMMGESQGSAPAKSDPVQNNIRIINSIDPSVMEDYLGSSEGEEVILNVIRNNPETVKAVGG